LITRFPRFGQWYREGFKSYGKYRCLYSKFSQLESETDSLICLPRVSVVRAKQGLETLNGADEKEINNQIEKALNSLVELEKLCCEINAKENITYLLAHRR
jgi:hypothetical protein